MKKTLFFHLLLLIALASTGQPPAVGSTRHYPELEKYVGTWLWQNGTSSIEMKFKKVYYNNGHTTEDILLGVHKYIKNGVVVEDNLSVYNELSQNKKGSLYVWVDWHLPNTDALMGTVRDVLKRKRLYIYINYFQGNPAQIKCNIETGDGFNFEPAYSGQTWPGGDLIFTKQ